MAAKLPCTGEKMAYSSGWTVSALVVISSFGSGHATASPPACRFTGTEKIPVVYFGGNKTTDRQVDSWSEAAQSIPRYGPKFRFEGHSLHQAPSDQKAVLAASRNDIQACVQAIDDPSFEGQVVLVGHSDGGWVINDIVKRVQPSNRTKIKFVSLDGYAANGPDFADVDVQCWTSYVTEKQPTLPRTCGDIRQEAKSLYTDEMARCKPGSCRFVAQSGCSTNWCPHFRLINTNVAAGVSQATYGAVGYDRIAPPLFYLDRFSTAGPANAHPAVQTDAADGI